ncbi:Na(+)/H(+) antiporter NhaA 3, partial [Bienertia sinuspersici]
MEVFLRKLISNALPLRINLIRRGVQVVSICPFCGECEETSETLFCDCTVARHVWFAFALSLRAEVAQSIPLGSPDMDINLAIELVIVLWAIWNHRNKIVFEACLVSPSTILQLCAQFSGVSHDPIEGYVWVDGSWKLGQKAKHKAGIGWVIANWLGPSRRLTILSASPLQPEAEALYEGLKQASSIGFQQIKIYYDSTVLIQLIINKLPGPPKVISALQSCRSLIS